MEVLFERFKKSGKGGGFSLSETEYSDYVVKLNSNGLGMVTAEFSGYDRFHSTFNNPQRIHREARKYADDLADVLELDRPEMKTMIRKTVTTEEWVAEEDDDG